MLVLWSDAVTYPLQHTSPQQVSAQLQPNSGQTHSRFKCANVEVTRAPGARRRVLSPGEKEEIAKSRQAVSKEFQTITCPEKPRVYRHLGATAATDIDALLTLLRSDRVNISRLYAAAQCRFSKQFWADANWLHLFPEGSGRGFSGGQWQRLSAPFDDYNHRTGNALKCKKVFLFFTVSPSCLHCHLVFTVSHHDVMSLPLGSNAARLPAEITPIYVDLQSKEAWPDPESALHTAHCSRTLCSRIIWWLHDDCLLTNSIKPFKIRLHSGCGCLQYIADRHLFLRSFLSFAWMWIFPILSVIIINIIIK